jgi:hypothetical protein
MSQGARLMDKGLHLYSIRQINAQMDDVKCAFYRSLIPEKLLVSRSFPSATKACSSDQLCFQIRCPENTGFVEIDVRHPADRRDPMLYVQIADTANGQLEVILVVINDPAAPRFDVDRDWEGNYIKLGTMARNIPAEIKAMNAGLAPGQVRKGLRLSKELVPMMEDLCLSLGKDRFFIEPLAYHTALMFERYGFAYMIGQTKMEQIHAGFQPGGELFTRLDRSTPFRQPRFAGQVRGRSWAIHDGVLGEPWAKVRMYKRVAFCAGICTFPGARY